MAKSSTQFICQNCGIAHPKWSGQCNGCGEWNTLVETVVASKAKKGFGAKTAIAAPVRLSEVTGKGFARTTTDIGELDRVLGGGIVPGSVILLAGEPGIGKSTLLTQLALNMSNKDAPSLRKGTSFNAEVLYVCGEESPEQIRMRIDRLSNKDAPSLRKGTSFSGAGLSFLPQMDVDVVTETISGIPQKPAVAIVDSIQTMSTTDLTGMAGSVGQIRECAYRLQNLAKSLNIPVILVGHVTKEGAIAGPKILEHLVDTVLYLEGDKKHTFRILRAQKNRFGSVDEVGVFLMADKGLLEVNNPSDLFLEERQSNVPGSAVVATMEGTRPVLVEVQGLVVPSQLAIPRRLGTGIDQKRLQLLVAVLTKRAGLPLGNSDVYVNVAGGLKLTEPAADLATCLALASSYKNRPLPPRAVAIGEVGLLGEVRKVSFLEKRTKEAKKLGFTKVISPLQVKTLREAIKVLG
jgi:DNA repair protein RadA/Sms